MFDCIKLLFWKWTAPVHVVRIDKIGGWACFDGDCMVSLDGGPWRFLPCGEEIDTRGLTWLEWRIRPRLAFPRPVSQ